MILSNLLWLAAFSKWSAVCLHTAGISLFPRADYVTRILQSNRFLLDSGRQVFPDRFFPLAHARAKNDCRGSLWVGRRACTLNRGSKVTKTFCRVAFVCPGDTVCRSIMEEIGVVTSSEPVRSGMAEIWCST